MIVGGIDVGSVSAKAVVMRDGKVVAASVIATSPDSAETARKVMEQALDAEKLSLEDVDCAVSTGYGRVNVPFAKKNLTEISCHARGTISVFPQVRTILDMGGQDCKAIRCDEEGKVTGFVMNDKCAAGTGRYLERVAAALGLPLNDIGGLSLEMIDGPTAISSYCAVFAQRDVVALLRQGKHVNDILAGASEGLAEKIQGLIKRVGLMEGFSISGGIAKNIGVVTRLEKNLSTKANIAPEPQTIGALGAALFAQDMIKNSMNNLGYS